jgi:hypothetical protein
MAFEDYAAALTSFKLASCFMTSSSSTVVEHSVHNPKGEGLSQATDTATGGREKKFVVL